MIVPQLWGRGPQTALEILYVHSQYWYVFIVSEIILGPRVMNSLLVNLFGTLYHRQHGSAAADLS